MIALWIRGVNEKNSHKALLYIESDYLIICIVISIIIAVIIYHSYHDQQHNLY